MEASAIDADAGLRRGEAHRGGWNETGGGAHS